MIVPRQRGFTLAELLIVLILVISAGGVVLTYAMQASATSRENQSAAMMRQLLLDTQALRADRNYAGVTPAELIRAGKVPAMWQTANGTAIQGPWGGAVTIEPWVGWYGAATAPNGFRVTAASLDTPTCYAIVQGTHSGTYGVAKPDFSAWAFLSERGDVRPQAAATAVACGAAGRGNSLAIYVHAGRL